MCQSLSRAILKQTLPTLITWGKTVERCMRHFRNTLRTIMERRSWSRVSTQRFSHFIKYALVINVLTTEFKENMSERLDYVVDAYCAALFSRCPRAR
jgi:hypothetical protein